MNDFREAEANAAWCEANGADPVWCECPHCGGPAWGLPLDSPVEAVPCASCGELCFGPSGLDDGVFHWN